jgi:hypothetical protein
MKPLLYSYQFVVYLFNMNLFSAAICSKHKSLGHFHELSVAGAIAHHLCPNHALHKFIIAIISGFVFFTFKDFILFLQFLLFGGLEKALHPNYPTILVTELAFNKCTYFFIYSRVSFCNCSLLQPLPSSAEHS